MKKYTILGITLLLLVVGILPIQAQYHLSGKSIMELKAEKITFADLEVPPLIGMGAVGSENASFEKDMPFLYSPTQIPRAWRYEELGMFCKFEVQLEKTAQFPVKIRLGEVEAVDRKEGKWQYDNWNK